MVYTWALPRAHSQDWKTHFLTSYSDSIFSEWPEPERWLTRGLAVSRRPSKRWAMPLKPRAEVARQMACDGWTWLVSYQQHEKISLLQITERERQKYEVVRSSSRSDSSPFRYCWGRRNVAVASFCLSDGCHVWEKLQTNYTVVPFSHKQL